jgi:hypothetical protein
MGEFCRKLPVQQGLHVQKTRISLPDGSMIEAVPNNPDTISSDCTLSVRKNS